jgi:hypothetical protein
MQNSKQVLDAYNDAIQRPLFIDKTPKPSIVFDVIVALVVATLLCVGALSYFDVLTH